MKREVWVMLAAAMMATSLARSQERIQTVVVDGYSGSVPVKQMNGKNYVEVEALARVVNGSLSFKATQIVLKLSSAGETKVAASPNPTAPPGLSKEFLRAGNEAMSAIRDWHSALASSFENQSGITPAELAGYQSEAMTSLQVEQAAVTTDADQKAAQLIANQYQQMKDLSDKYQEKRVNMSYIEPSALKNDSLDQDLVACGKLLREMMANGQFTEEPTCR